MMNTISDQIREHVRRKHVEVARRANQSQFEVRAGTVERELGMTNRTPQVCSALRSRKFLEANGLTLVRQDGPPSGMSTSVTFTFSFSAPPSQPKEAKRPGPPPAREAKSVYQKLREMRGIAHDIYALLGGPEKALDDERDGFSR